MADDSHGNPDSEAKKWFALALIGTLLYVTTVFVFVITADPGGAKHVPDNEVPARSAGADSANAGAEVQHGQSH
jgi:hypothetical protein